MMDAKKKYADWVEKYPKHLVLKKAGYYYMAWGRSAEVLNVVLGYKLAYTKKNKIPYTGGTSLEIIEDALKKSQINYIVVENENVISKADFKEKPDLFDEKSRTVQSAPRTQGKENSDLGRVSDEKRAYLRYDDETSTLFLYEYIPSRFWSTCEEYELIETNNILKYKSFMDEKDKENYPIVVAFTFDLLNALAAISKNQLKRPKGLVMISVPRSDPEKESTISHSIRLIAKLSADGVAKTNSDCRSPLIDASSLIKRTRYLDPVHKGAARRDIESQINSMAITYNGRLKNDVGYVIIDDIVTSGTQMKACRQLLQSKGVMSHNIVQLAIGRTVW